MTMLALGCLGGCLRHPDDAPAAMRLDAAVDARTDAAGGPGGAGGDNGLGGEAGDAGVGGQGGRDGGVGGDCAPGGALPALVPQACAFTITNTVLGTLDTRFDHPPMPVWNRATCGFEILTKSSGDAASPRLYPIGRRGSLPDLDLDGGRAICRDGCPDGATCYPYTVAADAEGVQVALLSVNPGEDAEPPLTMRMLAMDDLADPINCGADVSCRAGVVNDFPASTRGSGPVGGATLRGSFAYQYGVQLPQTGLVRGDLPDAQCAPPREPAAAQEHVPLGPRSLIAWNETLVMLAARTSGAIPVTSLLAAPADRDFQPVRLDIGADPAALEALLNGGGGDGDPFEAEWSGDPRDGFVAPVQDGSDRLWLVLRESSPRDDAACPGFSSNNGLWGYLTPPLDPLAQAFEIGEWIRLPLLLKHQCITSMAAVALPQGLAVVYHDLTFGGELWLVVFDNAGQAIGQARLAVRDDLFDGCLPQLQLAWNRLPFPAARFAVSWTCGSDAHYTEIDCRPSPGCWDGDAEAGAEVFGRDDIAFCRTPDDRLPLLANAHDICARGWRVCTGEDWRARNDACDRARLSFAGRLDDGDTCAATNRIDGGAADDCASDGHASGVESTCGGVEDAAAYGASAPPDCGPDGAWPDACGVMCCR